MIKQDSRTAFEQWHDDEFNVSNPHANVISNVKETRYKAWQAALAYATSKQAEREKRLAEAERIAANQAESALLWMPARTEREEVLQRSLRQLAAAIDGTDDYGRSIAAFNAQEQGR